MTPRETYKIRSFDGYELCAAYLPAKESSRRFMILSHGYTYTRNGALKYVCLFRKLGYNCIIYDNRGHEENPRTKVMFGLMESKDLMEVIQDTYERYGQDISIGLHGESMGGGLQINALKYKPKVDFVVNDCGYADLTSVLKWKATKGYSELHIFPGADHAAALASDVERYEAVLKKFLEKIYS